MELLLLVFCAVKKGTTVFIMNHMSPDLPRYTKCILLAAAADSGSVRLVRLSDVHKHRNDDGTYNDRALKECIFSLPRITFTFEHQHLKIHRTQFPIAPAYAYTVHKSQGQTLHRVLLDIRNGDIFSHGMLYVAASLRSRT